MSQRMTPTDCLAALVLAAILGACGSPSDPDPSAPVSAGSAPGGNGAAVASTAPSPAVSPVPTPRPARIAARASVSVEECIERNIHDKEYDAMNPRDARRKLRRLQVKADCESSLAAR